MAGLGLLISVAAWAQDRTQDQPKDKDQGQTQTTTPATTGTQTDTQTTTTTTTETETSGRYEYRTRLELTGFGGYTFNQGIDFGTGSNGSTSGAAVNFYNSIGLRDRFTYGAGIGYYITPNLQVGFLWNRQNNYLRLNGFNTTVATAAGWTGPGGTGATGTGDKTVFIPVLATTNGVAPYQIGKMNVDNFHGILSWDFGPPDSVVRPFVFGGAGATRFADVNYSFANGTAGAGSTTVAVIPEVSRFSTTWGIGFKIAPTKGLGIRVAGRWTPTRLRSGTFAAAAGSTTNNGTTGTGTTGTGTTGTGATGTGTTTTTVTTSSVAANNNAWWCNGFWGCSANTTSYLSQWAVTGGITLRF